MSEEREYKIAETLAPFVNVAFVVAAVVLIVLLAYMGILYLSSGA